MKKKAKRKKPMRILPPVAVPPPLPVEVEVMPPEHDHDVGPVLRMVSIPVHFIVERLHITSTGRIKKHQMRYVVGAVLMVVGSGSALAGSAMHLPHIIHLVVDIFGYGVHGCGAVPYASWVVRYFKLEPGE